MNEPQNPPWAAGPWAYEYDDSEGGFTVWLTENHSSYEPHHRIHFGSGMWSHYTDDELSPGEQSQFDEAEANARLIAAAPELVAALEAFSGDIADCECDIDLAASIQEGANASSAFGNCRHAVARSLLARVRGEEKQG